jgi:hypothetical protein
MRELAITAAVGMIALAIGFSLNEQPVSATGLPMDGCQCDAKLDQILDMLVSYQPDMTSTVPELFEAPAEAIPAAPVIVKALAPASSPTITVSGITYDRADFITQNYVRRWEYNGTGPLRNHLQSTHGITNDELNSMTLNDMVLVHSALHDMGNRSYSSKTVVRQAPRVARTKTYSSNCPGGVCPTNYRTGLFGRRRR